MHDGHDHHDHPHHHDHAPGPGHNHADAPRRAVQWQEPHREHGHDHGDAHAHGAMEPDLDLVEAAFAEGFVTASDPTSFLRLAHVKFTASAPDGATLSLLRVEIDHATDVGSVTPHLGGTSFRYDPLPARLVSRRKLLRFVYFDGKGLRALTLAEMRGLL